MVRCGGYLAHILILRPKSVISGSLEQRSKKLLFLAWQSIFFQTTSQTNHLDLNTIEAENFWKYFLVPWNLFGASRVPNLALNRGIFSKVNGTSPLGSRGHPRTIFCNGRFYRWQSSFGGDVICGWNITSFLLYFVRCHSIIIIAVMIPDATIKAWFIYQYICTSCPESKALCLFPQALCSFYWVGTPIHHRSPDAWWRLLYLTLGARCESWGCWVHCQLISLDQHPIGPPVARQWILIFQALCSSTKCF